MSNRTTEIWTLQKINDALLNLEHEEKKIVIPRFQRGQRWKPDQEESFIDSVRKGYPVGTLLFYKTVEADDSGKIKEVYTLVDGLQRSTAVSRYLQAPMKFFSEKDVSEEFVNDVFGLLGFPEIQKDNLKPIIINKYVDYIQGLKSFNNPQTYSLAKSIFDSIAVPNSDKMEEMIECLSKHLQETIQNHNEIAQSEIPAVVYTGDENDLPEIFRRINSKGTPLNQYEIYAASWPQKKTIEVRNIEIVNYVLAKYDALNDDIYNIQGYDRDEIRVSKKLTLFEYVFGLGKWLSATFPLISFDKHLKADEVTPIGFELLDACFFDTKKIGEIYKRLQDVNVNHLEKALTDCIKTVDKIVSPITRFKGNKRKDEIKPIYAKNQILSIIAFIFREKYSFDNLRCPKPDWNEKEELIKKRVFAHFVYDIISVEWDQGSSKLHQAIVTGRYNEDIASSAWESALTNMYEKEKLSQERSNVRKASNADIAFLNCIYLNKFTAMDQLSLERFDIEHIATKDLMKDLIQKASKNGGLPISCVANLCYLPEYENRAKGRNTFYQDTSYLNRVTLKEIEDKYSFTTYEDLEWVELPFVMGDFDDLKDEYISFLDKRFEIQKRKFYDVMGINPSVIGTVKAVEQKGKPKSARKIKYNSTQKYQPIIDGLEKRFNCKLELVSRTVVASRDKKEGIVMAYSKMYPQGTRRKYWFAIHPPKMEQCALYNNKYYTFACSDDNIAVSIPFEILSQHFKELNISKSKETGNIYYHMVLFVDNKKVSWFLSKPNNRELDISEYAFSI